MIAGGVKVTEDVALTSIAEHCHGIDTKAVACSNHTACNLATVGNEHLLEGLPSAHD